MIEGELGLGKDRLQKGPEIGFTIFYGVHGQSRNNAIFGELMKNADIYVPERLGWDKESLNLFRDVANGRVSAEKATRVYTQAYTQGVGYPLSSEFILEEFRMLYNTRKKIVFADIPREHPFILRYLRDPRNFTYRKTKAFRRHY